MSRSVRVSPLAGSSRPSTLESADTQMAPSTDPSAPPAPQVPLEVVGDRYELLAELGRGGEGVVYRARDTKADAIVAIKLIQREGAPELRLRRFRRELQLARKVTHPNVVRIHDLVELPGRFGLSMELVEGEPLDALIARVGRLDATTLVALAKDLSRALAAAHEAGVTHRDLKPANVLLRRGTGRAVVTDFGVSRLHGSAHEGAGMGGETAPVRITQEGAIIGTPLYMAPEQLAGRTDIGPAADVYAFGLLAFEAATGKRLHEGPTVGDVRRARLAEPAPALSEQRPDLPRSFCEVIDRCLARDAAERFPSGVELSAALDALVAATPRRIPATRVALAAAIVVAGAAGLLLARRSARPVQMPAAAPSESPATAPLAFHPQRLRRITFADGCEEFPSFTPDGKSVVYDGAEGPNSYLYMLALDGSPPRQLTHVSGWDLAGAVSPRGDRVAFVRAAGGRPATYVTDLAGGSEPRMIGEGGGRPSWSPDGKAVWAGDRTHLRLVDVDSG